MNKKNDFTYMYRIEFLGSCRLSNYPGMANIFAVKQIICFSGVFAITKKGEFAV